MKGAGEGGGGGKSGGRRGGTWEVNGDARVGVNRAECRKRKRDSPCKSAREDQWWQ